MVISCLSLHLVIDTNFLNSLQATSYCFIPITDSYIPDACRYIIYPVLSIRYNMGMSDVTNTLASLLDLCLQSASNVVHVKC